MADHRDFRVRAFLHIENEGVARGLRNHVDAVSVDAVDINPGAPNAEPKSLRLNDTWEVTYDMCFPPDKQAEAEGLFNHTENVPRDHGYGSIERCGHRTKQPCEVVETWGQVPVVV